MIPAGITHGLLCKRDVRARGFGLSVRSGRGGLDRVVFVVFCPSRQHSPQGCFAIGIPLEKSGTC
jgi:hypothetical protein